MRGRYSTYRELPGFHDPARKRLLERMGSLPLTVLCGGPYCGKSILLRQWIEYAGHDRHVIVIAFPQKHLGEAGALSSMAAQVLRDPTISGESRDALERVLRGSVVARDFPDVLKPVYRDLRRVTTVAIVDYEWQSTPFLDGLLVDAVSSGVTVVCSLVDSTSMERTAIDRHVAIDVIDDSDLAMRTEELVSVAVEAGVEPDDGVLDRVMALTAGYPLLSGAILHKVGGVGGVAISSRGMTVVSTERGSSRERGLLRVDPSAIDLRTAEETCRLMSSFSGPVDTLSASPQGRSPFMRACRVLRSFSQIRVKALEDCLPEFRPAADRLVEAGYAHYVADIKQGLRFVWMPAVRMFLIAVLSPDKESRGCAGAIGDWYADHDDLQSFMESVEGSGDDELVENVVRDHFLELLWGLRSNRHVGGAWTSPRARPREFPLTVVLDLALRFSVDGSADDSVEDSELRSELRQAFEVIDARLCVAVASESGGARSLASLYSAGGLALIVLRDWNLSPGYEKRFEEFLMLCRSHGWLDSRVECRLNLQLGMMAILRMRVACALGCYSRACLTAESWDRDVRDFVGLATSILADITGVDIPVPEARGIGSPRDSFGKKLFMAQFPLMRRFHEALAVLERSWDQLSHGHETDAMGALSRYVVNDPRALTIPIVQWSLECFYLFCGRYREAFRLIDSEHWHWRRYFPIPDLMFVTDVMAVYRGSSNPREYLRHFPDDMGDDARSVLAGVGALMDKNYAALARGLSPQSIPPSLAYFYRSTRLRMIVIILRAALELRSGDADEAERLCAMVCDDVSRSNLGVALRLVSRSDVDALMRLPSMARLMETDPSRAEVVMDAREASHVLAEVLESPLSPAQTTVLKALAEGKANSQIAADLYLSVNTVKSHLRHIYAVLGVRNRREAVAKARESGLI